MRNILFILVMALTSLAAYGQDRGGDTGARDSLVIGAYTFYCRDYDEDLGGGVYELKGRYSDEELDLLFLKLNRPDVRESLYARGYVVWARLKGKIRAPLSIMAYRADRYEAYAARVESEREREAAEARKRLESF